MPQTPRHDSPTRFLIRALARGMTVRDVAAVTGDPPDTQHKRLRAAATRRGIPAPSASAGEGPLLDAVADLVVAMRGRSAERPATTCPAEDVARAVAGGDLAGPLLLATIEHIADCDACIDRLARHRHDIAIGRPDAVPVDPPRRPDRATRWIVRGAIAIAGAVALTLLLRWIRG